MTTATRSSADKNDELVLAHYRSVAQQHGDSPRSTMEDDIVRQREVQLIQHFVAVLKSRFPGVLKVADVGCGNGSTLAALAPQFSADAFLGFDFSPELLSIAAARALPNCEFRNADVRALSANDSSFDAIYTERCLINLLDWHDQQRALLEIARVLKPGGFYLMIECFTDGLENNNRARAELELDAIPEAFHNK